IPEGICPFRMAELRPSCCALRFYTLPAMARESLLLKKIEGLHASEQGTLVTIQGSLKLFQRRADIGGWQTHANSEVIRHFKKFSRNNAGFKFAEQQIAELCCVAVLQSRKNNGAVFRPEKFKILPSGKKRLQH